MSRQRGAGASSGLQWWLVVAWSISVDLVEVKLN